MVYCRHCGAQMDDNAVFCPHCGAAVNSEVRQAVPLESDDIVNNKGISVLSYLGPLVFIPLFARKNSPFAQFHAKQGVTLLALNILCTVISSLLEMMLDTRWILLGGFFGAFCIQLIRYSLSACVVALAVFGIIHVVRGQKKPLPVIGWIKIVK